MADIGSILSSAVIFLFAEGGQVPLGTAFIVGYPVPEKTDQIVPLIVSARHVVAERPRIVGRFNTKEGKTTRNVVYDLKALRESNDLWEHEDSGVDLVVFRTPVYAEAAYGFVPLDLVATKEVFAAQVIQTTDRIVFPSLLINFMGSAKNYPVIRSGSIALLPDEPVSMKYQSGSKTIETKQEVIFIDGTAIPGASGSPVFLWPGPRSRGGAFAIGGTQPYLLGVLHGFYPTLPREVLHVDATGVKDLYTENSGVAIVFPSWRLRQILESPSVTKRVKELAK